MDGEDSRRIEEKMKLANFQIEKRLATLEEEMGEIKDNVRNVTEEIVYMKNSLSKTEKVQPLSSDISDLTKQFKDLRASFNDVRSKFANVGPSERQDIDAILKRIEKLEKRIALGVPVILE